LFNLSFSGIARASIRPVKHDWKERNGQRETKRNTIRKYEKRKN
jgi:hypothetical protein